MEESTYWYTGSYSFTFEGTSGGTTESVDLIMNVFTNSVNPAVLTSPSNGAIGTNSDVDLMWNGSPNTQDYFVEISTQSDFSTIFDSATVQTTLPLHRRRRPWSGDSRGVRRLNW